MGGEISAQAMQKTPEPGRTAPLVIDLAAGTVIVHGEEVELPLREFTLLAALAQRVGEPIASSELLKIIWAEDSEWTAPENLRILVTRLRRKIDGATKFGQNIRNRRGFGYLLDLDPAEVLIREGSNGQQSATAPADVGTADDITPEALAQQTDLLLTTDSQIPVSSSEELLGDRPSLDFRRRAAIAALVSALLAGSWFTGYVLSSPDGQPPLTEHETEPEARGQRVVSEHGERTPKARHQKRGDRSQKRAAIRSKNDQEVVHSSEVMAAPGGSTATSGSDSGSAKDSRSAAPTSKEKEAAVSPALPPPPTRYLYHLVHPDTGDHFVTTDMATVSEQEAKGYQGGPTGRVYTYREDGTKAIQTNRGTAYVFIEAASKTEPASRTVALWYSTNGAGDFFFTTSQSEATQDGWTGSRIGFVRAL